MADLIETDVAIIGAGPVGLFAAFECGMLKLRSALIDALAEIGGQCSALYPEKPIYDIPAHPAIAAGHLICPARAADRCRSRCRAACWGSRVDRRSRARQGRSRCTTDGGGDGDGAQGGAAGGGRGSVRPEPAAARRVGAHTRRPGRGAVSRAAAGRLSSGRQSGDRRRWGQRGGLGAVAEGRGRCGCTWCTAGPKFRAAPETAAQLDGGGGRARRNRAGDPVPVACAAGRREDGVLTGVEVAHLDGSDPRAGGGPAAAVLRALDGFGANCGLGARPGAPPRAGRPRPRAKPACPACLPSATW